MTVGAQPKKQMAKSKQRSRAAHFRAATHGLSYCSHCHSPKLPHRVCPACGRYGGREVIAAADLERG